jgi:enoyl-[acyl-carrier protein] reductase I
MTSETAAPPNTTPSTPTGPIAGTLMAGKRGLIMGVANDRSLAWGIASALAAQGAELAFTFQGEALQKRVEPLAASIGSKIVLPCDVTDEPSMDKVFETLAAQWGKLDFVVHAIGSTSPATRSPRWRSARPR